MDHPVGRTRGERTDDFFFARNRRCSRRRSHEAIKNINELTKAGTGSYVRMFYQGATKGGERYQSLRGHWVEAVPYSWYISKADNILFRTVSVDKVVKNLERLWDKYPERAQSLWLSQPGMVTDAFRYLGNLSAGREGADGLNTSKKDFINLALGLNTKERARTNPLYDPESCRKLESFITSRRIDRTSRIVLSDRRHALPWSYQAYVRGVMNLSAGSSEAFPNVRSAKTDEQKPRIDGQSLGQ